MVMQRKETIVVPNEMMFQIRYKRDTSENARTTEDVLQVLKNFSRSQSPSM